MKHINKVKQKLEWEKYYDPDFDWNNYCLYVNGDLTEDFIEEFADKVDWHYICSCQDLSESLMRKYSDKLDWITVSRWQTLSEQFIEDFSQEINWHDISYGCAFSETFIEKYLNKLDLIHLSYEKCTEEFKQKCLKYHFNKEYYIMVEEK